MAARPPRRRCRRRLRSARRSPSSPCARARRWSRGRCPPRTAEDALIPPPGPWRLDALERGTLAEPRPRPKRRGAPGPDRGAGPHARRRAQLPRRAGRPRHVSRARHRSAARAREWWWRPAPRSSDLSPGDRVMGLIPDAFGPLAVSERDLLVDDPRGAGPSSRRRRCRSSSPPPTTACSTSPI